MVIFTIDLLLRLFYTGSMAERKKKMLMKDYGFKTIAFYMKEEEYEAMRKYCFDERLKHSVFIRGLVTGKLRKEGYLKKEEKKG